MVRDAAPSQDVLPHQVWWPCIKYLPKSRSQWPSYGTWHFLWFGKPASNSIKDMLQTRFSKR